MKLVELIKVSAAQSSGGSVSNLDLLLETIFGGKIPSMFVPGAKYTAGDKVYVKDEDGNVKIYECLKSGVYDEITPEGWKEFQVEGGSSSSGGLATNPVEFTPGGYYLVGDIVYIKGDDDTLSIYKCIEEGIHDSVTDGGWENVTYGVLAGNLVDEETLKQILNSIFGPGMTPPAFEPGKTYEAGDIVYIIDDNGIIHIKECIVPGSYPDTNNDGWQNADISNITGLGSYRIATDDEIIEMFMVNGGFGPELPDDGTSGSGTVVINNYYNTYPDENGDGTPDTLWNEF